MADGSFIDSSFVFGCLVIFNVTQEKEEKRFATPSSCKEIVAGNRFYDFDSFGFVFCFWFDVRYKSKQ
jgi:hypothetical protein